MPRRRSTQPPQDGGGPVTLTAPKFLSRRELLEDGSEQLVIDLHEEDRSVVVTPERVRAVLQRPQGLTRIAHAQCLSVVSPEGSGFDALFRDEVHFTPQYGRAEDIYEVFRAWAFAHLLRPFIPVRPIAFFTGEPGAAKTSTAAAVGQLWYGRECPAALPKRVPDSPRDFQAAVAHAPYLIFDNAEVTQAWLPDSLCIVSSGDGLETRVLHTTATSMTILPDTFLALTSFTGQVATRGDLLSRALVFRLGLPPRGNFGKLEWMDRIERYRARVWEEGLHLARALLEHRRAHGPPERGGQNGVPALPAGRQSFDRLQDFSYIGTFIAHHFGGTEAATRFRRGMATIALSRVLAGAADPDVEAIVALAVRGQGEERWYSTSDLVRVAAEVIGGERGFDLTLRSASQRSAWIRTIMTRAPGIVQIQQRRVNGLNQWKVELSGWCVEAARLLGIEEVPAAASCEQSSPVLW